ncbi:hypothetical protein RCH16_002922 [Cryobacterium sp. MP_M5]|nr:HAD-IC family P-type ATPase [Cryobacterium sp. MP_M3]MBG6060122.1 hypothetical protein [Cryobacterium sp. MP_M3]MEC5177896.1 hypothetical protein [Cryobacterium sp. MP_M5]
MRVIAVIGLLAALAVTVIYGLTRGVWLEGVLAGIATAMAMLPEEFPVVLAVFLALGAWRMSQRHILTRRMPVIETLGTATVICVDKTGTLTMNSMTAQELVVDGASHVIDGRPVPERFHPLVEFGRLASPIDPFDPMDLAFTELADACLAGTEHAHPGWELVREYPLSDKLLALSHVWRSPNGTDYVIAAKGHQRPSPTSAISTRNGSRVSPSRWTVPRGEASGYWLWRAPSSAANAPSRRRNTTSNSSSWAWPGCGIPCARASRRPSPSVRAPESAPS